MRARWATDTIARWFAVNIVMAIVVCLVLIATFIQVAGGVAQQLSMKVGLVEQTADIVRVLNVAPAPLRPKLAAAEGNELYRVAWYPNATSLPIRMNDSTERFADQIRQRLARPHARIALSESTDASRRSYFRKDYVLVIDLPDGSWVSFVFLGRVWGLNTYAKNSLIVLFVLVSSLVVASVASRRLARPMERFSRAAERFGADLHAPPMKRAGPLEFRIAIDAFNDMQARVQRIITDRTEMLAAISHDLRAPLTRMRLRGEFIEDAEQQHKLFRDVDEMQAMVNASLSFFRDDNEHEALTRFDMSELVNTVLDDFRDAGNQVSFDGPSNQVYFGRPFALRRAIANVVDNAVKYGQSAAVSLVVTEEDLQLRIDDQGHGIPEELQETVFRPFFRVEPSRNRQTGGVGLGLSAARSTVRGHGGDVTLTNRNPNGLRVTLLLPMHKESDVPLAS